MSTVNRDGVFNFSIGEISFLALKTVGSLKISLPPCDLWKWLFGVFSYYEMAFSCFSLVRDGFLDFFLVRDGFLEFFLTTRCLFGVFSFYERVFSRNENTHEKKQNKEKTIANEKKQNKNKTRVCVRMRACVCCSKIVLSPRTGGVPLLMLVLLALQTRFL